ncbi:MAG: Zn-dependent alcohol dehydrogenase [Caldilineaceae bacterium]|nr:Zn-dependent alcohol dehydrogenase [Caldilineaceae bacterium]MCB9152415.1 Zn-dependent alcohol dehydrogenase [Caldilineaceae bacterium]
MMKMRAAVARELNQLAVETVELDSPKDDEVLVRIRAAGVCHSDLHTLRGELRARPPIVLGHEGAGIVEQVGASVTSVKPGDRVMINWLPSCGVCKTCLDDHPSLCETFPGTVFQGLLRDGSSRLHTEDGLTLKHFLSAATMAEYVVVPQAGAIPVPDDVPFDVAAVIGCAVMTGVGAVINTAQARPGRSAVIIGCGGVGLCIVMGAVLAGCHPIIAVDVLESKLNFAREMGATHTINGKEVDAVKEILKMTGGGADYVFDSVGMPMTMEQAVRATGNYGATVVTGMHDVLQPVPLPVGPIIFQNKRFLGSFVGSSKPQTDLPRLVELYRGGRLPLDKLISKHYTLDDVNTAFDDMVAGSVARGVLMLD